MKKQFTILLILVFVLGLTPLNFSEAITQNQIDAEVQIVCTDGSDNWFSGSGTIIDPKGIILTNRHVVEGAYMNTCFIGFIESISQEPNFGTAGNYNLAEVKYQTISNDMDAAILYLDNLTNKIYPYINIWDSNSDALQFGDKIEVIGFPSIGGSTITYTSGDFSGFGSSADGTQNYIKSTAPLEHGNSGGASYNPSGQFIGIPTMVVAGTLNSLSYVLSVNSIKDWLGGKLGKQYKQEIIEQEPIIIKPIVSINDDITPPNIKTLDSYFQYYVYDDNLDYLGFGGASKENYFKSSKYKNFRFILPKQSYDKDYIDLMDTESGVYSVYYNYSTNLSSAINDAGKEIVVEKNYENWGYYINVTDIISLPVEGTYYISLKFKDRAGNISNNYILTYVYEKEYFKGIKNVKFYKDKEYKNIIADYNYDLKDSGNNFKYCVTKHKDIYFEWSFNEDYKQYIVKDFPTDMSGLIKSDKDSENYTQINENKYAINNLNFPKENNEYFGANICENKEDTWCHTTGKVTTFLLKPVISDGDLFLEGKNMIIKFAYNPNVKYDLLCGDPDYNRLNNFNQPYYILKKGNPIDFDLVLSNKLKGLILLQIEENGEAYYIYPEDSKRYYLGRPADAFNAMRKLGLGATHEFINSYTTYPDHVLGKILIDVEQNGEAYYIYPKDKKAYYLGRPADAFRIMRELGLGITNDDLNKIPEGSL